MTLFGQVVPRYWLPLREISLRQVTYFIISRNTKHSNIRDLYDNEFTVFIQQLTWENIALISSKFALNSLDNYQSFLTLFNCHLWQHWYKSVNQVHNMLGYPIQCTMVFPIYYVKNYFVVEKAEEHRNLKISGIFYKLSDVKNLLSCVRAFQETGLFFSYYVYKIFFQIDKKEVFYRRWN